MAETIKPVNEKKLICVLCGREWVPSIKNLCECGGFCTWGYTLNEPESFHIDDKGNGISIPFQKNLKNKF
jgi:hypothetical protein